MAKRLMAKQTEMKLIPESDLLRLDKQLAEQEAIISEARGVMGSIATKTAAKWGTNNPALRIARRWKRKPAAQAADFFQQLCYYWERYRIGLEEAKPAATKRRGRPPKKAAEVIQFQEAAE